MYQVPRYLVNVAKDTHKNVAFGFSDYSFWSREDDVAMKDKRQE